LTQDADNNSLHSFNADSIVANSTEVLDVLPVEFTDVRSELSIIRGRKGGRQAVYNGYVYTFDRAIKNGTIYWQCKDRKQYDPPCTGRLYTNGEESVIREKEHRSHLSSIPSANAAAFISKIKHNSTTEAPGNVLRAEPQYCRHDVKAVIPSAENLKRQIRRYRKKVHCLPTNPKTAAEINIPESMKTDGTGRVFLQHDTVTSRGKRLLIFATDTMLDASNCSEVDIVNADGTFKTCPPQFAQTWIVRARIQNVSLPICYALLEDKSAPSYTAVLQFLKDRCPRLNPHTCITDFEKAELSSFGQVFPNATLCGCLFHFCQAQERRFKMFPSLSDDELLSTLLRTIFGLPFVPLNDVPGAWSELKERLMLLYPIPQTQQYVQYFETTWVS
jgi:hypothetical protein